MIPGRTTAEKIQGIVEWDSDTWPSLDPFIDIANELVTERCTNSGYSADRLEKIERWLAAHFYASAPDPRTSMERAGTVSQMFQFKIGMGFKGTQYGMTAMRLDTAGNLASLDNTMDTVKVPIGGVGIRYLGIPDVDVARQAEDDLEEFG